MRAWLEDPSGLLTRLLPLARSVDDAASLTRFFGDRGQLLTDGTTSLVLGINELTALLSFEPEERAGRDLLEHYRWYGSTPGEHGPGICEALGRVPVDPAWTERLRTVGLAVLDRREAARFAASTWSIVLSTEDI